ncbi:Microtubule-associated protein RP/EB member 1 [Phytophthora boehmeriae]|uniref:Microtubule-associated protein RP/EB member 1 n=1 Tax=Phytophthora boehmeriae TaxID=109152 RepID=A0A8T1WY27_9STRA|nr:Microtubule-associated protein RP/EB member 1 [Phytophthora boehmeriae]
MSGNAYFVGRKEVLEWVNTVCGTELTSVEQTCTGAIACQVLDSLYPGKVPMNKVDWGAIHDYEFVYNYKLLQQCFFVLQIDKQIPVNRLVRGKYQDNFEFMQWLKAFYDGHEHREPYDPFVRRAKGKGGAAYNRNSCRSKFVTTATPHIQTPRRTTPTKSTRKSPRRPMGSPDIKELCTGMASQERIDTLKAENEELAESNERLRASLENVEKDRAFYYRKIEAIENLIREIELTNSADEETATAVLDVLYASEEEQ